MKRVSVCMATYNGERFIKEQLTSILKQLGPHDEVVISDDHSTDGTIEIINSFVDNRIRLIYNEEDRGYTGNFENALKNSLGQYILLSDQDDIWDEQKVAVCLDYLQKYDFIVSDAHLINEYNSVILDSFYSVRKPFKNWLGNIVKFGYLGCCFAFRRDVLLRSLPFPPDRTLCTHDNWIFLIAASFFHIHCINEKLILYRRHETNTSAGGAKSKTTFLFKVRYRIYLLLHLLGRLNK